MLAHHFLGPFSRDNNLIISLSRDSKFMVLPRSQLDFPIDVLTVSIDNVRRRDQDDQQIRLYFNQGLTQAEMALCLSIIDNIHISLRQLRRRPARLQLYR